MKTLSDIVKEKLPAEPALSFDRSDIERRLALPAGKFTSPGPLLAPLAAALLTVGFYGVLALAPATRFAQMFTQRSAVPYAIVFLTSWSFMILLVKRSKLSLQRRALSLKVLPAEDPGFILSPASAEDLLSRLYQSVDDPEKFLLPRRICHALSNLRNMGRIGDVDEVLRTQADNDETAIDSSYTLLRGLIWAIPVLGFIGTVWGLSLALGSFGGVLTSAQDTGQLRDALQSITGGLSTAFETTLQGLVAALCVHMLMILVRRREEQFLDDCRDFCQKYVVGRLRLANTEGPS